MAQFIVWGSPYCPYCTEALKRFKEENIKTDYRNINDSLSRMREFLAIRKSTDALGEYLPYKKSELITNR